MSTASRVLARYKTATASALRDLLVRVRRENVSGARSKWGDCELVSDEFLSEARRAGLAPVGRSFIVWGERSYDPAFAARRRIELKSGQHQWVVVEGVIYDGTSDQFGDDEITIAREGDDRYRELRRFGHTFRTAGLEVYLNDPGKVPGIGPERGKKPPGNGIAKFTSPHGSYRYVAYVDGKAVAALQIVSRDKKTAVIANVYTDPSVRRQGWASTLLAQARKDFKKVEHASEDDLSEDGRAWRDRVKAASMWLDMAIDKMYPPVMEWVHRPSAGKSEVFEAYRSLSPREKAAYDADVRAAFTRAHGAKVIAYRYKERPRHMGGMSLTTEEPTYLSPDKYTAYEVDADDVLVHWAQDNMPLGGRAFGHEKELILKPEANPRVV